MVRDQRTDKDKVEFMESSWITSPSPSVQNGVALNRLLDYFHSYANTYCYR